MDTIPCNSCGCSTVPPVQVPGNPGEDGAPGADGQSAYTLTTADVTIPAVGAMVIVSVESSLWMAIGQVLVLDGPAHFEVIAKPSATSVTLEFLGYTNDLAPAATISSGATVSPAGVQYNPVQPCFAANMNNVDQTAIVTATITQLQFSNEVFDPNSCYDTGTYRFTPSVAGIYLMTISVEVKAMADTKIVTVYLYKNGVAVASQKVQLAGTTSGQAAVNFRVAANGTTDYFTAHVQQDSGGNKDVDGTNSKTFFQGSFAGNS